MLPATIITNSRYELSTVEMDRRVSKTVFTVRRHQLAYMRELLPRLVADPLPYAVKVHSFTLDLSSPYTGYPYGYQYVMSRLSPLTSEEQEMVYVFAGIDDMGEEDNRPRRFSQEKSDQITDRLLDHKKLLRFLRRVGPVYDDLHEHNVMKTASGRYQVIDLETFINVGVGGECILPHDQPI